MVSMKKGWKVLLKLAVSVLLIAILLYKVNLTRLWDTILRVGVARFLALALIYMLSQLISSIRWSMVIRSLGKKMGVIELFEAYMLGMYANLFLPSIIGGDAARAYLVSRKIGLRKAVSSIFLERYNGLVALMAISLVSVTLYPSFFPDRLRIAILMVSVFVLLAVFMLRFKPFNRFSKIRAFFEDIMMFHRSFYVVPVTALSFVVQFVVIGVYVLAGRMLGFDVSAVYYFAFIPVINLISLLPISFNGVGVREFSFVYFFAFAHLNRVEALSLSLVVFFVVVFCSLIGGVVYLVSGKRVIGEAKELYREEQIDSRG